MSNVIDHPSEETLERFLMNKCAEAEGVTVETHILACESCVARMEALEDEIGEMRLVLQQWQRQQAIAAMTGSVPQERDKRSWLVRKLHFKWLPVPGFALAGGLAAIALGTLFLPQFHLVSAPVADVSITAMRGSESTRVPGHRPIRLHLNANGLSSGAVVVQVVDETGTPTWEGRGTVHGGSVEVSMPPINNPGNHLARLYTVDGRARGPLLREYSMDVQ